MSVSYEAGIRPHRIEFVRESTQGESPSNPSWENYSDTIRSFDPSIEPGTEGQRGLGDPDPKDHFTGTGTYELTVEYDLQRWFEDNNGNPNDAAGDGLQRDSDNRLPNSHTIVRTMEQSDIESENAVDPSPSVTHDTRQYLVYKGAKVDTVTLTGDPTSPQPIMVALDYVAEKGETHQIDQPASSQTLVVSSSDASDTSQTLTIETSGAGTSEDVSLNGGTAVVTSNSFDNIDAAELDAETSGNVSIRSSSNDDVLMEIRGMNAYDFDEGDLGVPTTGTGSHAGDVGSSYEIVQGDSIERPNGTELADEINSTEFTVENNVTDDATTTGPRPIVVAEERNTTVDATVFGETEYHDNLIDSLTTTKNTVRWEMDGGRIEATDAAVMSVDGTEEPEQGIMETDVQFEGEGVSVN